MNLVCATLSLVITQGFSVDDLAMHVANSGFVVEGSRDEAGSASVNYRRTVDHASIKVRLLDIADAQPDKVWRELTTYAGPIEYPTTAPSGAPLGDRVTFIADVSGTRIVARLSDTCIVSDVTYKPTAPTPLAPAVMADEAGDKELIEGLARNVLAKIFGRTLLTAPDAVVNGITITQARRTPGGATYVPLIQWAQARGITLAETARLGTYRFTRSNVQFTIALAAKSAKKGVVWQPIGGFALKVSGATYVPLAGMENLIQ